jgi:hypothetical protein
MRTPREGQYWRNKRSGRPCLVKMVRGGLVTYRYLYPDVQGGRTIPLVMKVPFFAAAFETEDA